MLEDFWKKCNTLARNYESGLYWKTHTEQKLSTRDLTRLIVYSLSEAILRDLLQ